MGRKLTEGAKEKIRQKAMGHKRNLGRKLSAHTRKLIGDANRGRKHTDETKKLLRKQRSDIPLKPETVAKMRAEKSAIMECMYCGKTAKAGHIKSRHLKHCKERIKTCHSNQDQASQPLNIM